MRGDIKHSKNITSMNSTIHSAPNAGINENSASHISKGKNGTYTRTQMEDVMRQREEVMRQREEGGTKRRGDAGIIENMNSNHKDRLDNNRLDNNRVDNKGHRNDNTSINFAAQNIKNQVQNSNYGRREEIIRGGKTTIMGEDNAGTKTFEAV